MIRSALPEERFFSAIQAVLKSETNWIARQNNLFCCAISFELQRETIWIAEVIGCLVVRQIAACHS